MANGYPQAVTADGWRLLGRERELDAILAAYASHGNGVVLTGTGGIGKTRLAKEAVTRLVPHPGGAEWVMATRAAAAIDFGAVWHLLPADTRLDGGRLAIFRQLANRFRTVGGGHRRAVVVVDDAHLLDHASAAFVHYLAVHTLAFLIVTVRAGEPTPDAITALWKEGLVNRIDLPALSVTASAHLLDDLLDGLLGDRPDDQRDSRLGERHGDRLDAVSRRELARFGVGNPLLLRELFQAAAEAGTLRCVAGIWRWSGTTPITSRLAEVVTAQIGTVDEDVRTVLEVLACGEPLPAPLLERIVDGRAVAAAERANLVIMEPSGGHLAARLAHPLYREVIKETLPAARARAVWDQLAGALPGALMPYWKRLPRTWVWPLNLGFSVDPDVLVTAAREAMAHADHGLAERLARSARTYGGGYPADQLLAEILTHQGRYGEAAGLLPGSPPADGRDHPRWTITRASILYWGQSDAAEAERTLSQAAATRQRDMAEAIRCRILLFDGRCREALAVGKALLQAPDASPQAVVWASAGVITAAGLAGQIDQATAAYRRGLAVAERHQRDLPWGRTQVGYAWCLTLLATGRLRDARLLADQEYETAAAEQVAVIVGGWAALRGAVAKAQGRALLATRALREAVALLDGYDTCRLARPCLAELAGAAALAADPDAASAWLDRADQREQPTSRLFEPWVELNRAWTLAAHGEVSRAAACARHAAELARSTEQPTHEATALYAAARLGDARVTRHRLGDLAADLGAPFTIMARVTAALADQQTAPLESGADAFHELGLSLYAAEAATAAARMHRRAGRRTLAIRCLEKAVVFGNDCPHARTPLLDSTDLSGTLTRREREVALLAVAGRSSREIAGQLGLSVRTVDNYLGRAYAKLGISGRSELTGLLGLLRPAPAPAPASAPSSGGTRAAPYGPRPAPRTAARHLAMGG